MVSAAVLMSVSPVLGMSANSASVQAAPVAHAKGVNNTYGKNSRVKLTKTMKFVDRYGKKTSKTAPKGGTYTIWNVKTIDGQVYYSTVTYKSGNKTYTLKSNGSKVTTTVSSNKKTTSSKNSKTTKSSKTSESTSKKSTKSDTKSKSTSTTKKETATKSDTSKSDSKKSTSTKKATSSKSTNKTTSKKSVTIKPVKITMKNRAYVYKLRWQGCYCKGLRH